MFAWSPVSHPPAEQCKGPAEFWQKLPLKFKGVCSNSFAQKLEVTHYCFLLATALVSTLVSWCESEQNNTLPSKFASLNLRSSKHNDHPPNQDHQYQPRPVCLRLGATQSKNLTTEEPAIQKVTLQRTAYVKSTFFCSGVLLKWDKHHVSLTWQPATERTNQAVFLTRYMPSSFRSPKLRWHYLAVTELAKMLSVGNCACYINYGLKWFKQVYGSNNSIS